MWFRYELDEQNEKTLLLWYLCWICRLMRTKRLKEEYSDPDENAWELNCFGRCSDQTICVLEGNVRKSDERELKTLEKFNLQFNIFNNDQRLKANGE
jgi:hypothetical protein